MAVTDAAAAGQQSQRYRQWPFATLPLSCDALVLTPAEWQALMIEGPQDPAWRASLLALQHDCRWVWCREA